MNKEFIPYEQALSLKELGFDEECFNYYDDDNEEQIFKLFPYLSNTGITSSQRCKNRGFEKTIGAPYWFLELYTLFKHYYKVGDFKLQDKLMEIIANLSSVESILWKQYVKSIELIREKNLHKYGVGNGAYHLNVMEQIIFKK
jgi:hypothetical protein